MIDPYVRQRALPGWPEASQGLLAAARVAIVGVGGIGCPAALYVAAAGVGHLTLIDADVVSVTNLHRQVLFGPEDVGLRKALVAAGALRRIAPSLAVEAKVERLAPATAVSLLAGHDVVIDGTDTFASRLAVADAATALGIPVAWGAVQGWYGQVTVFDRTVRLRDVFPEEPVADLEVCETGAVLGTVCGQVGAAVATEAVKVITGIGTTLAGTLALVDSRTGRWREVQVASRVTADA